MGGQTIIAVGQMCSASSMEPNLRQVEILVQKAVKAGAKALFLPEASDYVSSSLQGTISHVLPVSESPFVLGLQTLAKANRLAITAGIHEPGLESKDKVRNTAIWIDEDGEIVQRYQKLHLFDVDIPGGPVAKESDVVEEGPEILPAFQTAVGKVGLQICFDLRYPEPALSLKRQGAHIITYPSAFTVPTGKAHWELLLRARAVETQSYVVAAAQAGHHSEKRVSYGHSIIIGPWGEILAELGGEFEDSEGNAGPEIVTATIDTSYVERIRREVPLRRRWDVYAEL